MIKQNTIQVLGFLLATILCVSCGKVTQITKKDSDKKTFSVTYPIKLSEKSSSKISSTSVGGQFSVDNPWIYSQISGIKTDGSKDTLSWGKAKLKKVVTTASPNVSGSKKEAKNIVSYISTAYRKDGVKLSSAKSKWGYLSFNNKAKEWTSNHVNVKSNYDVFLLSTYDKKGTYTLHIIDQEMVNNQSKLTLTAPTAYDNFIAVLFLIDLSDSKAGLKDVFSISELSRLFTMDFFDALNYTPPKNLIKKFRVNQPAFVFKRKLETKLLDVARLARTQDQEEVKALLKKMRKSKHLSVKASQHLEKNANSFKEDQ